jgi:hypothetical protein
MVHRVPRHRSCRYHQRRPRRKQRENRRRTGSLRMSEPSRSVARTAAALATRRRNTQAALGRVRDTIAGLRREKAPITVAAVARRAGVSRPYFTPIRTRKPQSRKPSGRPATNSTDLLSRLTTHANQPGVSGPSMPRTHSRPPTRRFCFNATAFANCSARSVTWKPNGHAMTSSESPREHHS